MENTEKEKVEKGLKSKKNKVVFCIAILANLINLYRSENPKWKQDKQDVSKLCIEPLLMSHPKLFFRDGLGTSD